jgi:cytochrome c553
MNKLLHSLFAAMLVACFASTVSAQAIKGDVKAGEAKNAMCIGCHGIKGYQASFPEVYKVPMISGQSAAYIASSLKAYQTGDRKHPTMKAVAAPLTEQDMADLGAYYEQHGKIECKTTLDAKGMVSPACLSSAPSQTPNPKVKAILDKAACASCHGANFSKPLDASQPKLAGQHKDYLYVALKAYKTEGNAKVGRNNGVMTGIAKQLSLSDMKELAGYISSLDGEMTVTPQNKFR